MRDNNHINSVARSLKILEIFGESSRPLTLTEVANLTNLAKSTAQRFLETLLSLGYLNREQDKRYTLSTKIISLAFHYLNTSDLASLAKPYLDELSSQLRMSTHLAVLDDCDIIILYRRQVRNFFNFAIHAGSKMPAYSSALGRILLAGLDDVELNNRLDSMRTPMMTPKTITSKTGLLERIEEIRKSGFTISEQEQSMDLSSMAVPLVNDQQKIVAAINVSLEVMRVNDQMVETAKKKLIETGKSISRLLGYKGPYPQAYS
jgi:IclR family pca regulon transcriptional regulator